MIYFEIKEYSIQASNIFEEVKHQWNEINTNPSLASESVLPTELSNIKDVTPYYLIVSKNHHPIGVIYYQMLHFNSSYIDLGVLDKWYYNLLQFFIRRIKTDLLICGNLFRIDFKGFDGLTGDEVTQITTQIIEENLFGKKICGSLLKDLEEHISLKTQSKFGFKAMHSDVTMEMQIRPTWQNIEDYHTDLTRKYRKRAQNIRKSLSAITIKTLSLNEIQNQTERIYQLYNEIVKKQIVRLGVLNGSYFVEMKQLFGDKFEVFGFYEGDAMVAFSSHIYYEGRMEIYYIGFSYPKNDKYQLYFNILFHGLQTAIEKKLIKIELGRTAKEAKASMGAEPAENINYYCINNPFLKTLFNKIRKNFAKKMGENWANRQPLK